MVFLALLPSSGACTTPTCDEGLDGSVVVEVTNLPDEVKATGELVLTGTATSAAAITGLSVAGVPAESTAGDYDRWTVTLTPQLLASLVGDDRTASLEAQVWTPCAEEPQAVEELITVVVPAETVAVRGLTVTAETLTPCALPADGSRSVEISVCADEASKGGKVNLVATNADLVGPDESGQLTLGDESGCDEVGAFAIAVPTEARDIRIVASASGAEPDEEFVTVLDAPAWSETGVELSPGQTRNLVVRSAAPLAVCDVVVDVPAHVGVLRLDDQDLSSGQVTFDETTLDCDELEEDVRVLTVQTADDAGASSVSVRCEDMLGQDAGTILTILPSGG